MKSFNVEAGKGNTETTVFSAGEHSALGALHSSLLLGLSCLTGTRKEKLC
ncbi:MAG: hypothetical protein ACETVX_04300 [bacterium]